MGIRGGTVKALVAIISGYVAQQSGLVPQLLVGSGELGQYHNFVVVTFVGLVVANLLTDDVHLGLPVLGAVKGLSAIVSAAIPLVYFGEFRPFLEFCSVAGDTIEAVVGTGQCYPYLKLVAGTTVSFIISNILPPFSSKPD